MENPTPRWLIWAAMSLLLWNLMGIAAFVSQWGMSAHEIAALPQQQQELWKAMPAWAWVAYALAVVAGTGAAIGLVFRKWWSTLLFGLSLIAVLIQFSYPFLVASSAQRGLDLLALPIFIVVMAVIQWQLSRHWQRKGWLA